MLCNDEMRQGILARLHGYRYEHTLGCERAARKLAERFGGAVLILMGVKILLEHLGVLG